MPLINVIAKSVNDAWQIALARVLREGDDIKTEYDNPNDPPSKDATVAVEITDAFNHPLLMRGKPRKIKSNAGNKWDVYGCDADTFLIGSIQSNYIEEVLGGLNDRYLSESSKSFPYSYHDRLFKYKPYALEDVGWFDKDGNYHIYDNEVVRDISTHIWKDVKNHAKLQLDDYGNMDGDKFEVNDAMWLYRRNKYKKVREDGEWLRIIKAVNGSHDITIPIEMLKFHEFNQLEPMVDKLKSSPYSRRCQAITWRPYSDPFRGDPPCLQRIWCRIINGKLKLQATWRSRDLFRAWEPNVNGMLYIQKMMADEIDCELGSYVDFNNSLHIYGSTFKDLLDVMERMRERGNIHPELDEQIEPLRELIG